MTRYRNRRSTGFTLIELLLVLVILAVLMGIVIPKFAGKADQARKTAAKTQVNSLETSIDLYEQEHTHYPTDAEGGLQALVNPPADPNATTKQYIKEIPKDPWGNQYQYKAPGTHNPNSFDVYSLGPDGREGGDDIGNWTDDAQK